MGNSVLLLLFVALLGGNGFAFVPYSSSSISYRKQQDTTNSIMTPTSIQLSSSSYYRDNKKQRKGGAFDKNYGRQRQASKRQERVAQLVQSELSKIIYTGQIKQIRGDLTDFLEDELRQRISVVSVDISPDLKQARVSVSIRSNNNRNTNFAGTTLFEEEEEEEEEEDEDDDEEEDEFDDEYEIFPNNPVVDKRRAYSWLVRNTKSIRHTLAQKMSHMKSSPSLNFVQVDVAAAVDVMYLIDKVAAGYKRETVGGADSLPKGVVQGIDFDEEFDEDEWEEEDDDFF